MKRLDLVSLALIGALATGSALAQSPGTDAPVRGSKVKGAPSEIQYNPRFGTMMSSTAERDYVTAVIYNYQTGEISLGGEFDPRTGKRLTAATPAAPAPADESVPVRGTKVGGSAEEIQYNPRFGTIMSSAAERDYVTGLIYNPHTREIYLAGAFDPRTGRPLRDPATMTGSHRPDHNVTPEYVPPPTRGMHWN